MQSALIGEVGVLTCGILEPTGSSLPFQAAEEH